MTHAEENNILRKTISEQSKQIERLNKQLLEYEGDFTAKKQIKYLCEKYVALQSKFDKLADAAKHLVDNPIERTVTKEVIKETNLDYKESYQKHMNENSKLKFRIKLFKEITGVSVHNTIAKHYKELKNNDSNRTS